MRILGKSRWAEGRAGAQAQTGVSLEHAEVSGLEPEHEEGSEGRTSVAHINKQV